MTQWIIRDARPEDCTQIIALIKDMAAFEKLSERVTLTEKQLYEDMFGDDQYFKFLVAETSDESVSKLIGYATYFFTYSTFEGRSLYLEELYVTEEHRHKGIGTAMWRKVAKIGKRKNCKRLEFVSIDWNKNAIDLYESYGAVNITAKEGWQLFRMEGEALEKFASKGE